MKTIHKPSHWIAVSLVTAAALLTLTEAWAQSGAAAVFEGRPSMAGAQAGQGAMAGPPQGGIGLQGSEGTRSLNLRRPSGLDAPKDMPQGAPVDGVTPVALGDAERKLDHKEIQPKRDPGVAKKQRSTSDKMERAAKRTNEAARFGVSPIDSR